MSLFIIQCAYGAEYERLLRLTRNRHAAMYGIESLRHFGAVRNDRPATWDKIHWLNKVAIEAADGDIIVNLDCDVLGMAAVDFNSVLFDNDFAAVRNIWDVFNGGVMFWRVNKATRQTIAAIEREGPDPNRPRMEQETVTRYVQKRLKYRQLPRNFNDYDYALPMIDTSLPIYFRAWHGHGAQHAAMEIERAMA